MRMEQRHRQEEETQPQNTQDDTISLIRNGRTCCSWVSPFPAVLVGQNSAQEGQKDRGCHPIGVTALQPRKNLMLEGLQPQDLRAELHNWRLSQVVLQDLNLPTTEFYPELCTGTPRPWIWPGGDKQGDTQREGQAADQPSTCSLRRGNPSHRMLYGVWFFLEQNMNNVNGDRASRQ